MGVTCETLSPASSLREPAAEDEVTKRDQVASVGGHHFPVAASQWPVGPPAVLDQPRLADPFDGVAGDVLRATVVGGFDGDGLGLREALHGSQGVSARRRSGTGVSGSTSRMRRAASASAAARAWRTASRTPPARTAAASC